VNEVVRGSVELLRRSIPKDIEISTNLAQETPVIMADPTQLQQVLLNLAVNARDAMPRGGRLTIETAIVGKENGAAGIPASKGSFVKLSVFDTGVGISKDIQGKIFDPFFTSKETGKGTGLGLYIVHSIVNSHGGYINFYSEPSRGTHFNIYFPIAGTAETGGSPVVQELAGSGTVLVIDDEAHVRELCADLLTPLGYQVLAAGSGDDGIALFRENREQISLVILDMVMPKMSGSEIFQALRTIDPSVKIILCSGYSQNGFAGIENLLREGAAGFVQKPFTRQTIAMSIKKILADEK
jgi:CheY-like chemotaxis protein